MSARTSRRWTARLRQLHYHPAGPVLCLKLTVKFLPHPPKRATFAISPTRLALWSVILHGPLMASGWHTFQTNPASTSFSLKTPTAWVRQRRYRLVRLLLFTTSPSGHRTAKRLLSATSV